MSVLRSYQAEHGPDFPWSVGKDGPYWRAEEGRTSQTGAEGLFSICRGRHECRGTEAAGTVPGELGGEGLLGEAYQNLCRILEWVGSSKGKLPCTYLPCLSPQARKHLHNFEATHCTPLPAQHFQMPWHL